MTRDVDTLLRGADPLLGRSDDDTAVLGAARARVDRERAAAVRVPAHRRPRWARRIVLVAAAGAVLTAVPLVLSAVTGDDGTRPPLLPAAVAADGTIQCGSPYVSAVDPKDAAVRLLPDRLPPGWSYTKIFARDFRPTATCIPPSLTALRENPDGLVTGRISVTGPVDARLDEGKLATRSTPDTVLGHAARRIDVQQADIAFHRWVFTDEQGRRWSVEASGMPLAEARQELAAVTIAGSRVTWDAAAAPGWTLVHLRQSPPYGANSRLTWWVDLTDGHQRRLLQVYLTEGETVPLLASTAVGDRVTTVAGHPAVLAHPRGGAEAGEAPGTETTPVLVELAPGTVAFSWATADDLPDVEHMLASLKQVPRDDPRLQRYSPD